MKVSGILATIAVILLTAGTVLAAGSLTVSTSPVAFGVYDLFSPADNVVGQGEVAVTYVVGPNPNPPITYTITISVSPNSGGINPRTMKQIPPTIDAMNYNVYTDAARTIIWNNAITGAADNVILTLKRNDPQPQRTPIYGRIPALQDIGVGSYSDSLTVTVVW
ncbi:MAG: spore coat U domain-containing protein [Nitrospiraceae bacterium]|nr:spore coat U domain-containing protein [Nitrospiraceae bacterium]